MRWLPIGQGTGVGAQGGRRAPHLRARFVSRLFLESSRTFHILEKLYVAPLSLYKPDMWVSFGYFLITPYRNRYSPKLVEFCQCNPYI
jgi:hypothetical protein